MEGLFEEIIRAFGIPGTFIGHKELNAGNINQTYCLHFMGDGDEYYILQRINTYVFRQPEKVMGNILRVTSHIRKKLQRAGCEHAHRRVLFFLTTDEGLPYYENANGFWRAYHFVDNAHTYDYIHKPEYFRMAGCAFGEFQEMLADFPAETLTETIPHFHDTPDRIRQLKQAVEEDKAGRVQEVQEEIQFILDRESESSIIAKALEEGRIPYRVTHNDTKINNVLFDDESDQPICVIDLDTVMPGSSLYDYGDAIRSGSNIAGEDEENLALVRFDLELFEAFTSGYLEKAGSRLTAEEVALFPAAARILTLELSARFLTDYLNGDVYFKVKKPGHNLIRTRNQIELVRQMEEKADIMDAIVAKYA